jgi:hypothetical protein
VSTYQRDPAAIARLSPEQYRVTQQSGTETPGTGESTTRRSRVSKSTLCRANRCSPRPPNSNRDVAGRASPSRSNLPTSRNCRTRRWVWSALRCVQGSATVPRFYSGCLPAITRWATCQPLTPMVDFDQRLITLLAARWHAPSPPSVRSEWHSKRLSRHRRVRSRPTSRCPETG